MSSSDFSPNSAEEIGYNEDLLIEILLNLPTKSLIRFKVVSKQWMSLISSTKFCLAHTHSLHTKGSLKPSALFFDNFDLSGSGFSFVPLTHDCVRLPSFDFTGVLYIQILQSCNGLLLCGDLDHGTKRYFICNPITRKFKMVPIRNPDKDYELIGVSLAFDPLKSPHHKIISVWGMKVRWHSRSRPNFIDIYSSETDSWSYSKIEFTCNWIVRYDHGIFFKGTIHWDSKLYEMHYFDVKNECLKTMPMPRVPLSDEDLRYFGESGGSLNLAVAKHKGFSIFEMLEDHSGWNLKHCLNYDLFSREYRFEPYKLFCAIRSDEEGYSIFILCRDGSAMSYNFKDGTKKELHYCPTDDCRDQYEWFQGSQYIETLSCIL